MELISSKSCTCALYCFKIEFKIKNALLLTFLYSSFVYCIHKAGSIYHLPPTIQSFILTSLSPKSILLSLSLEKSTLPMDINQTWYKGIASYNKTRYITLHQGWMRHCSSGKSLPKAGKRDDPAPTSRVLTRTPNYSAKTYM